MPTVQIVAYFFVPLPEPLGLPDGYVFQVTSSLSYEEWLAAHEEGEHPDPDTTYTDASFKFWRVTATVNDFSGVMSLFDVAGRALPLQTRSNSEREQAKTEGLRVERTIVEMAIPLPEPSPDEETDAFSKAFDFGIHMLREFQRSYALVRMRPLTLITRERLPFGVLLGVRRITEEEDQWPDGVSLYLVNMNLHSITRDPDLTDADVEALGSAIHVHAEGKAFTVYADLSREARVALDLNGDMRQAVILAATATEVLLDSLLCHMLWEEGKRPEEAAELYNGSRGFISRVKTHFSSRLGGTWTLTGAGQVANWHDNLILLRHRIMHAGYEPSLHEARSAIDGMAALDEFLRDRLADPHTIARYPRTSMGVLGKPGLERDGRWDEQLEQLAHDPDEPNWIHTFGRWRLTMDELRTDGLAVQPDPSRAFLIAVVHPGGNVVWVLHDRQARRACRAVPPDPSLEQVTQILATLARQSRDYPTQYFSAHAIGLTSSQEPGAEWLPEYRVVPMAGVMLNFQDIDPI